MFCHFHKKRLAINICSNCDIPLCLDCRVLVKGHIFCKKCSTIDIPDFFVIPKRKPSTAAFFSLCMPGAGQVYNGQLRKGIFILLTSWLVVPWFFGIYDAFTTAKRINRDGITSPPSLLAFFIFTFFVLTLYLSVFFVYQYYAELNYPQVEARRNLNKLSGALEAFKRDYGAYPEDYMQIYDTEPRYIDELYCDVDIASYRYTCVFTPQRYQLKAEPIEVEKARKAKAFMVETGGVWSENELSQE